MCQFHYKACFEGALISFTFNVFFLICVCYGFNISTLSDYIYNYLYKPQGPQRLPGFNESRDFEDVRRVLRSHNTDFLSPCHMQCLVCLYCILVYHVRFKCLFAIH